MSKDKLKRFAENETFPLLFQPKLEDVFRTSYKLQGKWHQEVFRNHSPIVLELGCGRGEYTIALSERYPDQNFIGVDVKGARLWRGAKTAVEENRANVAFLRTRIEFLENIFAPEEISEIWLTFPDPQIRRLNRRLTGPRFLDKYVQILSPGAKVHLKTDSLFLHEYTLEVLQADPRFAVEDACRDLYAQRHPGPEDILSVTTHYEEGYLSEGKPITYLRFCRL